MSMRLNLKRGNEDAAVVARFCAASVLTALFIALAVTVKFVDTSAIGPNGTVVGLSAVNGAVRDAVGYSETWYALSEALGCFPIGVLLGLVIIGAAELIKTKKISAELWILAAFYVLLAAIYVAFELIGLNYRPVLLGDEPEASFPSSHTLLAVFSAASTSSLIARRRQKRGVKIFAVVFLAALCCAEVVARTLSGVHWITDIAASLLLGGALSLFAAALFDTARGKRGKNKEKNGAQNEKITP